MTFNYSQRLKYKTHRYFLRSIMFKVIGCSLKVLFEGMRRFYDTYKFINSLKSMFIRTYN